MPNINQKPITLLIPKSFQMTTKTFKLELNSLFEIMSGNLTDEGKKEMFEFLDKHPELEQIIGRLDKRW